MASEVKKFADGIYVEVTKANDVKEVSAKGEPSLSECAKKIVPILDAVCGPVVEALNKLRKITSLEKTEIELSAGITAEGNLIFTKVTAEANLKITVTLSHMDKI